MDNNNGEKDLKKFCCCLKIPGVLDSMVPRLTFWVMAKNLKLAVAEAEIAVQNHPQYGAERQKEGATLECYCECEEE